MSRRAGGAGGCSGPRSAAFVSAPRRAVAGLLAEALSRRSGRGTVWLDQPFGLYLAEEQADAYLDATADARYSDLFVRPLRTLIEQNAAAATSGFRTSVTFVDLGPGELANSLPFLIALQRAGVRVAYVPVDISRKLLQVSSALARQHGLEVQGLNCLFEELPGLLPAEPRPRLVNFGPTFMNYRPRQALALLRALLRTGDAGLVAVELFESRDTSLAPYTSPSAAWFTFLPLRTLGIARTQATYVVRFLRSRVEMGFRLVTDVRCDELVLPRHTHIVTAISYRHTRDRFRTLIGTFGASTLYEDPAGSVAVARISLG